MENLILALGAVTAFLFLFLPKTAFNLKASFAKLFGVKIKGRDNAIRAYRIIGILLVIFLLAYLVIKPKTSTQITSFRECIREGNPVMESYPRKCSTNGETFIEDIGNEIELSNTIRVQNPRPNTLVASPIEVRGAARGAWFFEADFSVYLYDENGTLLGQALATAMDDWMTEDFVAFKADLSFTNPETETGELILEKANPSGLPENEEEFRIPVRFD